MLLDISILNTAQCSLTLSVPRTSFSIRSFLTPQHPGKCAQTLDVLQKMTSTFSAQNPLVCCTVKRMKTSPVVKIAPIRSSAKAYECVCDANLTSLRFLFERPASRVHDNVHDDMNMSLIMHDHKPVHSYAQHIIPHDQ